MEILFAELREKEIVNISDGKKLGHAIDVLFDIETGIIKGIVVPGERKFLKKSEDIFISLEKLKKIGDDVVLVKLPSFQNNNFSANYERDIVSVQNNRYDKFNRNVSSKNISKQKFYVENDGYRRYRLENKFNGQSQSNKKSYVRFKPINKIKYK